MQSEVVATVEGMGFDRSQIQTAVLRQLQDNQSNFNSAEVLLNALLDMPDDVINDDVIYQELNATMDDDTDEVQGAMGIVTSQGEGVEVKSSLKRNNEKFEQATPSENGQKPTKQQKIDKGPLYDELKSMEIESQCRSCKVKKADTLVIPCGHISFCSTCAASNAKKCAICKGKIAKYVKVFMA
uniref:RING-type domain-containing protein n=1 Tax=Ciona savignyi TaxID=51511 RepID=H2YMV7_CIOSA